MSFTLRQILGDKALTVERQCPTGKVGFATKAEADRVLRTFNANERNRMRRFRCGYCDQHHLGHRRGIII